MNCIHRLLSGVLVAACLFVHAGPAAAQARSDDGLWVQVDASTMRSAGSPRRIQPQRHLTMRLDEAALRRLLAAAPMERAGAMHGSASVLSLPDPGGGFQRFHIVESPIMAPGLAARFPQLRTYAGQGIDDPTATLRFDVTPRGFRAQVISVRGRSYVDPYQDGDTATYVVYHRADAPTRSQTLQCAVSGHTHGLLPGSKQAVDAAAGHLASATFSGASLRTYRLAMAATGEYTAFHGGTVADGLAAILTTMNRVNGIYERELAVRMVLVEDNDRIIYTDAATDPYTNNSGGAMLGENQITLDAVIGPANYDIGHVVSTGGGGVAYLGSVCAGNKAGGVTGSSAPLGDPFDVDYVAHEIGHQFRGNHTFNGAGCGSQRNAGTAFEPGSGVTIQAYAGICGADNLQPNSESYFHRASLNEMLAFVATGGGASCATSVPTGNTPPTVTTAPAFTIPRQTPFELTAAGDDADGDVLTYLWEQFDLGGANAAGSLSDTGSGPLFRSFAPSLHGSRVFPSLRYVLGNANAPPSSAPLPGTPSPNLFTGEALPNSNRTLNFRVTVRDNRSGGGGTAMASTAVTVTTAAGPFRVTAPNTAVAWPAGSTQTVNWDVAGTDQAPIGTSQVRIRLSLDGGHSWPIVLAEAVDNTGSASVTIPAETPVGTQARVRVEAVGNVYFDVSDVDFAITGTNTAPTINVSGSVTTRQGSPAASAVVATVNDAEDAAGSLQVQVSGAPPGLEVTASNNGGSITLSAAADCTLVAPGGTRVYPLLLGVTDSGGATTTAPVNVNVSRNLAPTLGSYTGLTLLRGEQATVIPSAAPADPNGNLVGATISPSVLPGGGSIDIAADGSVDIRLVAGTQVGTYTLRPQIADSCGAMEARSFELVVASLEPLLAVHGAVVSSGNGVIEPGECNEFHVSLSNSGLTPATAVSAQLSTTTPGVTISQAFTHFDDIPSASTRSGQRPFRISTATGLTCFANIDLTLTVTYAGGGSPYSTGIALPVGQPAAVNYVFSGSSGASLPAGGTLVPGSQVIDGVVDISVPSGFSFRVYDTEVTGGQTLRVSSNGSLQLVGSGGSRAYTNAPLPSAGNTDTNHGAFPANAPVLAPYWDDLNLTTTGSPNAGIYQQLLGVAPNRTWRIEWRGKHYNDPNGTRTKHFAIDIAEGDGGFAYVYALTGGTEPNGQSATIGVQAATTGTRFTQHGFGTASVAPGLRLQAAIPRAICSVGNGGCAGQGVSLLHGGGGLAVSEGGAGDGYSLVLDTEPTGTVTIEVSADAQLAVDPVQLVFDADSWATPQAILVEAVDDSVAEGPHTGLIQHQVSGADYDGVLIDDLVVAITDNDTATLVAAPQVMAEGDVGTAPMVFTLELQGEVANGFRVDYATRDDTATAGEDYHATEGTFRFDGDLGQSRTITVQIIGDLEPEADERFWLDLAVPETPWVLLQPASVAGEIVNDDFIADVAVALQRQPGSLRPGGVIAYSLAVRNLSEVVAVPAVDVVLEPSPLLQQLLWSCTASADSSCNGAAGHGAIERRIALAAGGRVDFTITALLAENAVVGAAVTSSAEASVVAPVVDPEPANDVAASHGVIGSEAVFRDGFELP